MALTTTEIRQELVLWRQKKTEADRKIAALESFLGQETGSAKNPSSISARGGVDIRPAVREVFEANGNQAMRKKDLVDTIGKKHPDTDRAIIEKKMTHVIRTILVQAEYGKYRLKTET